MKLVGGSKTAARARRAMCASAALAIAVLASGCGARDSASEPSYEDVDEGRASIQELWQEIREWRVEGGMEPHPQTHVMRATESHSVSALRACPTAPQTGRCRDVCNLKDAICDNAERICRIARAIGNDPWSAQRCSGAKASCKEARERCCGCVAEEPPSTGR